VSARGRRIAVGVALALVVGGTAFAIWHAPPLDLVPLATRFLTDLDEGHTLQALEGSVMQDRWDLPGLLESNAVRQRRLGRFVRVESAGPLEEVALPPHAGHGTGMRMRLTLAFERAKNETVFTFARVGSTWVVQDFEFGSMEPPQRPGLEVHMRRAGAQLAEELGWNRWTGVHNRLLRAERIANPMEVWIPRHESSLSGLGAFQRVEERAWTYADGKATFGARLVYESATKDVDLGLVFDPTEGRVVITRLAFL
jgi:hypothetical protein